MKRRIIYLVIFSGFLSVSAFAERETNATLLGKIWAIGKKESCSKEIRARFDDQALATLKASLTSEFDRSDLARHLNPFLFSLGYSHTQFFTDKSDAYYLFKGYYSLIEEAAPSAPMIINPGVQTAFDDRGYFVREVLHGLPAEAAGIVRGDRILTVDGVPFSGIWGSSSKPDSTVKIMHQGKFKEIHLNLPAMNWAQAFQNATLNSIRVMSHKGKKIGYMRLWSAVHPESAAALWRATKEFETAKGHHSRPPWRLWRCLLGASGSFLFK